MKVIIDIPEDIYKAICENRFVVDDWIAEEIKKGTLLSNYHPYIVTNPKSLDKWNFDSSNMWNEPICITKDYVVCREENKV